MNRNEIEEPEDLEQILQDMAEVAEEMELPDGLREMIHNVRKGRGWL